VDGGVDAGALPIRSDVAAGPFRPPYDRMTRLGTG